MNDLTPEIIEALLADETNFKFHPYPTPRMFWNDTLIAEGSYATCVLDFWWYLDELLKALVRAESIFLAENDLLLIEHDTDFGVFIRRYYMSPFGLRVAEGTPSTPSFIDIALGFPFTWLYEAVQIILKKENLTLSDPL